MPRIIGGSTAPADFGKMLGDLATTMYGDTARTEFNRQRIYAAQRENVETDNAGRMLADPNFSDAARLQATLHLAGKEPIDIGRALLTKFAYKLKPKDPMLSQAWVGAGNDYGSSPMGFDEQMAQKDRFKNMNIGQRRWETEQNIGQQRYEFDQTPVEALVGGRPAYVPRSGAFAPEVAPVLAETEIKAALAGRSFDNGFEGLNAPQQRYLGVDADLGDDPAAAFDTYQRLAVEQGMAPKAARQYALSQASRRGNGMSVTTSPDGATTIEMGGTPGLERGVRADLQKADFANARFKTLLEKTREAALKDPSNFGIVGVGKGIFQDTREVLGTVAREAGYHDPEEMLGQMRNSALRQGINPDLLPSAYDSDLPALQTLSDLLVFSAAEALAGQKGRDVSNADVERFRRIAGGADDWLMSQTKYLSKLQTLGEALSAAQQPVDQYLGRAAPPPAAPPPAEAAAAPSVVYEYVPGQGLRRKP
ncbi:hypothetical protein FHS85_000016 [Rhodoligotrophos appendicifer]|uniref:hypothetical protein n=1 Tax=Rhodoligotrophos appendicifer TaxID=987056 RepID=UPI00117C97EB|nr:hypothetical protein [Rhodoligotrophos appendicifer]